MKFCPDCGNKLDTVKKFCPECGSKLEMGEGPQGELSAAQEGQSKAAGPSSINVGDANIRTFQDANIKLGDGPAATGDKAAGKNAGGLAINVGDANVRTFEGANITGTQIGTNIENINIQGATAEDIRKILAEELSKLNLPKTVAKDTKMDLTDQETERVKSIAAKVQEADEHFGGLVGDPQTYVELGNVELLKGDIMKALDLYDKALKLDPNNVDAWNNKGYLLTNLGKPEDGLQCCEKATELDGTRGMAWNNKGFAQYRLGRIPDARRSFEKAIEVDKGLALSWYNLGILVGNQGGIDEAIHYFDKALEIDPNFDAAKQSKTICEQYKEATDGFEGFNDLDQWGFDGVDEDKVDNKKVDDYKGVAPQVDQSKAQQAYPSYSSPGIYQPQQQQGFRTYACPRCRTSLNYYPQYRRYYCHNCRMYI
jgi:tetratricopeptide (TPR) repeat protein